MRELPDKKYLRPDEVAEYFSVSRSTVYGWADIGVLQKTKFCGNVRFTVESVREFEKKEGERQITF